MSLDLSINIYMDKNSRDFAKLFNIIRNTLKYWGKTGQEWNGSELYKIPGDGSIKLKEDDPFVMQSNYPDKEMYTISDSSSYSCWRWEKNNVNRGISSIDIFTWGTKSPIHSLGDYEIDGSGTVNLNPANPYFIHVDEHLGQDQKLYNNYTEKNLESLFDLICLIIKKTSPLSLKVFTDSGIKIPVNAHCVYYDSPFSVLRDLQFLDQIWREGLPEYYPAIPPLNLFDESKHVFALNEFRTPKQRKDLCNDISNRLGAVELVTESMVMQALEESDYSIHLVNEGFLILDYPHFINSFVSNFYLDILDLAT